jgi:subtilisin family serine protease
MQWRSRALAAGCAVLVVAPIGPASAGAAPRPGAPSANIVAHTVTLITGDKIYLQRQPDGRQAATIQPGPSRERIDFYQHEVDGKLLVFPADVIPQLRDKRIDRALFDITTLIEQGYADDQSGTVPLIVTYPKGFQASVTPAAAEVGVTLNSVHGKALRADKRRATEFWQSLPNAGIERISLDRKVRASLDRSVPQIGAPQAWADGYDGRGTTVAVLDTGYDPTHPDLAGKVKQAQNFTPSPDTIDRFGHGTHVAATVAGNGERKGVAPGAGLLVGKVLDDTGTGYDSWIIAGMEWAAANGAKVVNLSLGGGPTDGTDPLSVGLNEISERTGTLFVVAGGNSGELGSNTIGTPGSAEAALTVGAVDRNEALASFSSRGPRIGDQAVKPDITAPGVDIVAARAAGTSMGRPVNDKYTAASGTSMATPHVAGAAAILAQRYPQWTGKQLKDALASTAKPAEKLSVFEQGGGRVDVPRSVRQGVYATGTLSLGPVYQGTVRKEVSYTNTTSSPVRLNLSLNLKSIANVPAGDGARLEKSTVDIAPGSSTSVGIVADAGKLANGTFGGTLTAAGNGVLAHTSVGVVKEAPRHRVTFSAIDSLGRPGFASPIVFFGEDYRFDVLAWVPEGGTWTAEVGEGTYYLNGLVDGETETPTATYQVINPAVRVTGDMSIVLDARKATEVKIETPKPAVQQGIWSFFVHREMAGRNISNYVMKFAGTRKLFVTPTPQVSDGILEFGSRWSYAAPLLTAQTWPVEVPIEPWYPETSPKLDGWRPLVVAWAGEGKPQDYRQHQVRGRLALVAPSVDDNDVAVLAANAAAAGAAMLMVITPDGTLGSPSPDRLPIVTVGVTAAQGARLAEAAKRRWLLMSLHGIPNSPYLYDIMHVERGRVPSKVVHRVTDRNSATVTTGYHELGGDNQLKEQRFGWRPWQQTAINQYQRVVTGTPRTREEIVSADDTTWQHRVNYFYSWDNMNPLMGGMTQAPRRYRAGERVRDDWFEPVIRPAIPRGVPGLVSTRDGDTLRLRIPEFTDGSGEHYGFLDDGEPESAAAALYRNGQLVGQAPYAWWDVPVSADPSTYRLDLRVERSNPEWRFSTRADTSWTFRSQRGAATLPLLQVDYRTEANLSNVLPAGRKSSIEFSVRNQQGPISARPKAWVSYDDGATWREVGVNHRGQAVIDHPRLDRTNGFVALRVRASDNAGNSVEQTVLRAYGLTRSG